jgi:hypothetical protein
MVFHTISSENFKEWEEPTLKIELGSIPVYLMDWFKKQEFISKIYKF